MLQRHNFVLSTHVHVSLLSMDLSATCEVVSVGLDVSFLDVVGLLASGALANAIPPWYRRAKTMLSYDGTHNENSFTLLSRPSERVRAGRARKWQETLLPAFYLFDQIRRNVPLCCVN
jgi:hypothetical protein